MNRIFEPRGYFTVPDGTEVSAFLNATDVTQNDVPWNALGDMSIASGRIAAGVVSWIHAHPVLTQVTYVVSGALTVHMKQPDEAQPYPLALHRGQAVLTPPGTLFQLDNQGEEIAEVLYVASPSYVFEMDGGEIVYDDAILVARSWVEMESAEFALPDLSPRNTANRRAAALARLERRKTG
jgi:mannose-6-phosphate isomerase-like protein (cupin superfamily)